MARSINKNTGSSKPSTPGATAEGFGEAFATGQLPGKWGVLQNIVAVWVPEKTDSKVLFRVRQAMSTVAILREEWRKAHPKPHTDPLSVFLEEHNLIRWPARSYDNIYYQGCKGLPMEILVVRPEDNEKELSDVAVMHVYTFPSGIKAFFYFVRHPIGEDDGNPSGPYIDKEHEETFPTAFQEKWWGDSTDGVSVSYRSNLVREEENREVFSRMTPPGDFVSYTDLQTSLNTITSRCKAFQQHDSPRRILFHGPPGTGKTTLARHVAKEVGAERVLRLESSALTHVGNTGLAFVLTMLRPTVLLMDDIDRNTSTVEVLLHFLESMEESSLSSLVVLATINSVAALDPALLRPGRFDEVHLVEEPGDDHRKNVITHYIIKYGLNPGNLDVDGLCEKMKGFAPSDIREVLTSVSKVGLVYLDDEVHRVRIQRNLYKGRRVQDFLQRNQAHKIAEEDFESD